MKSVIKLVQKNLSMSQNQASTVGGVELEQLMLALLSMKQALDLGSQLIKVD